MSKSQFAVMMDVLRDALRSRGLRFADVGRKLGVSERTVTRWFTSPSIESSTVERLCALVDLSFFELCELATKRVETRPSQLTFTQEQILAKDDLLSYLFAQILKGWTARELQQDMEIPEAVFVDALIKLEKAGLVDLLPGNEIRLRTTRKFQVKPRGPYSRYVNNWLARILDKPDIDEPRSVWRHDTLKLSAGSLAQLQQKFDVLIKEAQDLCDSDRRSGDSPGEWYGLTLVSRHLLPPSSLTEWTREVSYRNP